MKRCDCRCVECPSDSVTSPDTLRALADDHRLCEMPAKFRWSIQRAAAEIERLRLTDEERDAVEASMHGENDTSVISTLRNLLWRLK